MTLRGFKSYCLSRKGAEETYPHGDMSVWYKVMGKSFAWTFVREFKFNDQLAGPFTFINLKCEADRAIELRASYPSIIPGWHQNKKYWNSVFIDGSLEDSLIQEMIDHSYDLIVAGLTKKERLALEELEYAK